MDYSRVQEAIVNFIKSEIETRKSKGAVIGISGGIDSAVLAYLAVEALDKTNVLGILLPDDDITPANDIADGMQVCNQLGIESKIISINPVKKAFLDVLEKETKNRLVQGNLVARIRMCILYYYAALSGRLVVGSSNKTELVLGYFTKYGDGAADLLPLGDLYKSQIIELGKYLKIPDSILQKKSSARLWADQITEEELGLPFSQLDLIIDKIILGTQKGLREQQDKVIPSGTKASSSSSSSLTAEATKNGSDFLKESVAAVRGIETESIKRVQDLVITNEHKLSLPPVCNLSSITKK
ncbi:NAD+ synthase [Candidatus Nitrosocosmicus franklandus]|uniref:NH(3)-dependent NAD(+) synthetase n=1 Tax=Candidatus Nitrosocosmicus franklandianus TaxID=1798806 RepID=A0A484I6T3_9ARCH|nr:NAD+ synthase [Candidatus Nitrosocosmicus franklandus]VFJ12450.1 NH(3)-dependent NAD(+) synthetase [Candidatus Nitrosocosmicus franklandus]